MSTSARTLDEVRKALHAATRRVCEIRVRLEEIRKEGVALDAELMALVGDAFSCRGGTIVRLRDELVACKQREEDKRKRKVQVGECTYYVDRVTEKRIYAHAENASTYGVALERYFSRDTGEGSWGRIANFDPSEWTKDAVVA